MPCRNVCEGKITMSFVKWFSKRTSCPTYKTYAPSLSESFTYHWGSSVDLSPQYIICKSCVCEPCSRFKSGVEHLSCGTTAVPETQSYIEIPLRLVKQPLSGRVEINANPRHFGNLPSVLGITPATNLKFTDCQEAHRSASFHWWFFRLLVLEYRPLSPLLKRHFIIDDSFSWFSDYLLSTITVKTGDFLHLLFSRPFLGRVYDYTVIAGLITPGFSRHSASFFYKGIYELYHIIKRPLRIMYHFYIFEIRIRGTTRSTLSDIFERTTSSAKLPHSSVYAHSARLARHAHYPPLSLLNQDQRNNQTTSPNRIPIWIFMEKVQDQRNIHITRHLPKQIHYDHIILSIVIFLTIPAQSLSHTRLLTWE